MLTLSTLGKLFIRRHFKTFFLIFPSKQDLTFMQIVSNGNNLNELSKPISKRDNLHELSNSAFWVKIRKTNSKSCLLN